MQNFLQHALFIGQGIVLTLFLLAGGLMIGLILGVLFSFLRYQKIGNWLINGFISIMRGTPVILQLAFMYFALPVIVGLKPNVVVAGIVTFGLNSSAYLAEIFRAGIESLPKGQFEAAKTLQISTYYTWKDIILPQVIKNILPALLNEMIALLKETALIATIGGMDIMRRAQTVAAEQFTYFLPLCIAGLYYYLMVILIEQAGKYIQRGQHANH